MHVSYFSLSLRTSDYFHKGKYFEAREYVKCCLALFHVHASRGIFSSRHNAIANAYQSQRTKRQISWRRNDFFHFACSAVCSITSGKLIESRRQNRIHTQRRRIANWARFATIQFHLIYHFVYLANDNNYFQIVWNWFMAIKTKRFSTFSFLLFTSISIYSMGKTVLFDSSKLFLFSFFFGGLRTLNYWTTNISPWEIHRCIPWRQYTFLDHRIEMKT